MSRIMLAAVFGAGYVLGAKAGRQRYDQLSAKAQELWSSPKVQEQAEKVKEQAGKVQDQAKDRLADLTGKEGASGGAGAGADPGTHSADEEAEPSRG